MLSNHRMIQEIILLSVYFGMGSLNFVSMKKKIGQTGGITRYHHFELMTTTKK